VSEFLNNGIFRTVFICRLNNRRNHKMHWDLQEFVHTRDLHKNLLIPKSIRLLRKRPQKRSAHIFYYFEYKFALILTPELALPNSYQLLNENHNILTQVCVCPPKFSHLAYFIRCKIIYNMFSLLPERNSFWQARPPLSEGRVSLLNALVSLSQCRQYTIQKHAHRGSG
jgi:hypothetical protein